MAWGIIQTGKGQWQIHLFCFENIDGIINLLKQVIHIKIPISVLPHFENTLLHCFERLVPQVSE